MMTPMYFLFKVLVILENINHRTTSKNLILQSACQSGVGGGGVGWLPCPLSRKKNRGDEVNH